MLVFRKPVQGEHQRVDLIVVAAVWERQQLVFKISEPRCLGGQQNAASLKPSFVPAHSSFLVVRWMLSNDRQLRLLSQELNQPHPAGGVLHDDVRCIPLRGQGCRFCPCLPAPNSVFNEKYSLFLRSGNFAPNPRNHCQNGCVGTAVWPEIAKFPVNFPVSRE